MATLEELIRKGEKVVKGEKKKPKENEIRERYNLDALIEIAKRTLKSKEAYKYPHKEFAEVIGFDPMGKIKRPASGGVLEDEYNISLPNDLRAFIESGPMDGFDDTVRIRMSRERKVIVEPYKDYKDRIDKKRKKKKK
ncbi:hypothetical protein ES705_21246 [subsurface metagenome]|nr:hypothetical protein [Methanosarcinales archaeon]